MSQSKTDTVIERIARLESEVSELRKQLATAFAELRARGLKSLPSVSSEKRTRMSPEARADLKRQQLAKARKNRWPKAKKKKGSTR